MKTVFCKNTALFVLRSALCDPGAQASHAPLIPYEGERDRAVATASPAPAHRSQTTAPSSKRAQRKGAGTLAELRRQAAELSAAIPSVGSEAHIIVPPEARRGRHAGLVLHGWNAALPASRLIRIRHDTWSLGPELCLLDLSRSLDDVSLLMLAYEFCGTYAIDPDADAGFRARGPLTTPRRIAQVVAANPGVGGSKRLRRILPHVSAGSASPMESALALLVRLPHRMGGLALPPPLLNHTINPGRRGGVVADRSYYVCDLYWPQARIGLEYDSDAFHVGADRLSRDARRRAALQGLGVTTVTVTREQIRRPSDLRRLDETLHRLLGVQRRPRCKDYPDRQRTLQGQLLGTTAEPGTLAHTVRFGD
ncbi:MAG: hypothetical protein HFJ75_04200 [Eggerthellaceae bacterium]|nr:hypothetical protein [Eggerthellaceae bacterium]